MECDFPRHKQRIIVLPLIPPCSSPSSSSFVSFSPPLPFLLLSATVPLPFLLPSFDLPSHKERQKASKEALSGREEASTEREGSQQGLAAFRQINASLRAPSHGSYSQKQSSVFWGHWPGAVDPKGNDILFNTCFWPSTQCRTSSGLFGRKQKSKKDQEKSALALRSLLPSRYHRQVAGGALMGLTHHPDSPPKIGVCDPIFSLISLAYSLNLYRRAEISSQDCSYPLFHSRHSSFWLLSEEKKMSGICSV